MKIDRRITNGLAWAGVILVVGVPTADLLSAQFLGPSTPAPAQVAVVSEIAPIPAPLSQRPVAPIAKPAVDIAVTTPVKPAAPVVTALAASSSQTAGVVDTFLHSGKAMPDYITGGGASAAPAQVATTSPGRTPIVTPPAATTPGVDPMQVASIPSRTVAPVPMPLSMRPAPIMVPVAVTDPSAIVLPPGLSAPVRPPATVTAADLEDWETGPLSEFLARKQGRGSSATVTSDYDPNGFFLDQGPNPVRRDRVIEREEQGFPFFAD